PGGEGLRRDGVGAHRGRDVRDRARGARSAAGGVRARQSRGGARRGGAGHRGGERGEAHRILGRPARWVKFSPWRTRSAGERRLESWAGVSYSPTAAST